MLARVSAVEGSKENWHLNRGLASKHVDKVEKMFSICHRVAEWLCAQRHRWLERTETQQRAVGSPWKFIFC